MLKVETPPDPNERKYRAQTTVTLTPLVAQDAQRTVVRSSIEPVPPSEEEKAAAAGKKPAKPPAAKPAPKGVHPLLGTEVGTVLRGRWPARW